MLLSQFLDEGYILMPNVLGRMGEYLKYADLKFLDSAEGRASCIIQRAAALTMDVYVNPK